MGFDMPLKIIFAPDADADDDVSFFGSSVEVDDDSRCQAVLEIVGLSRKSAGLTTSRRLSKIEAKPIH